MSDVKIHPTAVVDPGAKLGAGSVVEAHAFVGEGVVLGKDSWVGPHAVITGRVRAGDGNRFFPFSSVGAPSQDLWNVGEEGWVSMGDRNVVRENVTINAGTSKEYRCTSIGNDCNIMAGCHIAHDCVIDDHVILANNVLLGGHVRVRDHANVGGATAVHHFATIGRFAHVAGLTRSLHDTPPWMVSEGNPARIRSVNVIGARRFGVSEDTIAALRDVCKRLFIKDDGGNRTDTRRVLRSDLELPPEVTEVLDALDAQTSGNKGRHLEKYRKDDRTLAIDELPAEDRPRFIP